MTFGPGALVADRFELVREIGGGELGRVWVARDRHLGGREVALRIVAAADPGVLLEEARWMGDAHAHTPAAIAVLDVVPTPGGGGYVASELVAGTPLEEVARRRAPLPVAEAAGYGVELLDAVITLRRRVPAAEGAVVGSALVGTDGRIRVTRFTRPPADVGAADAAVLGTAETLRDLLSGSRPPEGLSATIDDALAGRIATPQELRGRLLAEVAPEAPTAAAPPPPPVPQHRSHWPWIVAAIAVVLAVAVGLGVFLATRGDDDGAAQQATVPDVVGFTQDAAVNAMRDAGFAPQTKTGGSDTVAEGIVISTDPAGGATADTGSRVTITVSSGNGNVSVPTVIGTTREEATAVLQQAGLGSRVVEQQSGSVPEGVVISQQPTGGLQVPKGSTVAITVATPAATTSTTTPAPPATIAVPDVTGLTSEDASDRLVAAGLQPGTVTEAPADGVPAGQITAQSPSAGTEVAPRTKVDVTVAAGG
ncbi:MAG TPA: PASTA domain-containing protein [Miltoncostaeaceae bacterium]|nr:PASTA domain-containing protein [Miltoncostaeaceae bacterium]